MSHVYSYPLLNLYKRFSKVKLNFESLKNMNCPIILYLYIYNTFTYK